MNPSFQCSQGGSDYHLVSREDLSPPRYPRVTTPGQSSSLPPIDPSKTQSGDLRERLLDQRTERNDCEAMESFTEGITTPPLQREGERRKNLSAASGMATEGEEGPLSGDAEGEKLSRRFSLTASAATGYVRCLLCGLYLSIKDMPPHAAKCTDSSIVYEGWLMKWTNYLSTWQRRYVRIDWSAIRYSHDPSSPERDVFALATCGVSPCAIDPLRFEIATPKGRLALRARTPEEKKIWLDRLHCAKGGSYNALHLLRHSSGRVSLGNDPSQCGEQKYGDDDPTGLARDDAEGGCDESESPDETDGGFSRGDIHAARLHLRALYQEYQKTYHETCCIAKGVEDLESQRRLTSLLASLAAKMNKIQSATDMHCAQVDDVLSSEKAKCHALEKELRRIGKQNYKMQMKGSVVLERAARQIARNGDGGKGSGAFYSSFEVSKPQNASAHLPLTSSDACEDGGGGTAGAKDKGSRATGPRRRDSFTSQHDDVFYDAEEPSEENSEAGKDDEDDQLPSTLVYPPPFSSSADMKSRHQNQEKETGLGTSHVSWSSREDDTLASPTGDSTVSPPQTTSPIQSREASLSRTSVDQCQNGSTIFDQASHTPTDPISSAIAENFKRLSNYTRRDRLPEPRKEVSASIWSILKDFIGKDLSRVTMPVYFNEPTSFLQRLAEDLQYASLLNQATQLTTSTHRLAYVAVFALTPFASTVGRFVKPFNPLLGETFECTHRGFAMIAEQVGHHPPISAYDATCPGKFKIYGQVHLKNKFYGKSIEAIPSGTIHCQITPSEGTNNPNDSAGKARDEHYSWCRPHMMINNILFGNLWIEWYGTLVVRNHTTGDVAILELMRKGWFDKKVHQVRGVVVSAAGVVHWIVGGVWSVELWIERALPPLPATRATVANIDKLVAVHSQSHAQSPKNQYSNSAASPAYMRERSVDDNICTAPPPPTGACAAAIGQLVDWDTMRGDSTTRAVLWRPARLAPHAEKYFNYSQMAMELNEISPDYDRDCGAPIPPTDSRYRPDQRAYEHGDIERAQELKHHLEERQRAQAARRKRGEEDYAPAWFKKVRHPITKELEWLSTGDYWQAKKANDFSRSLNLFDSTMQYTPSSSS